MTSVFWLNIVLLSIGVWTPISWGGLGTGVKITYYGRVKKYIIHTPFLVPGIHTCSCTCHGNVMVNVKVLEYFSFPIDNTHFSFMHFWSVKVNNPILSPPVVRLSLTFFTPTTPRPPFLATPV